MSHDQYSCHSLSNDVHALSKDALRAVASSSDSKQQCPSINALVIDSYRTEDEIGCMHSATDSEPPFTGDNTLSETSGESESLIHSASNSSPISSVVNMAPSIGQSPFFDVAIPMEDDSDLGLSLWMDEEMSGTSLLCPNYTDAFGKEEEPQPACLPMCFDGPSGTIVASSVCPPPKVILIALL